MHITSFFFNVDMIKKKKSLLKLPKHYFPSIKSHVGSFLDAFVVHTQGKIFPQKNQKLIFGHQIFKYYLNI